jgi:hypothetical protein
MQAPRIEDRLGTYAACFEAEQQLEEAAAVAASHKAAQAELRASACFRAALARALALGNFLNWGGRLGGAAGFRLKNLPKLQVPPGLCHLFVKCVPYCLGLMLRLITMLCILANHCYSLHSIVLHPASAWI